MTVDTAKEKKKPKRVPQEDLNFSVGNKNAGGWNKESAWDNWDATDEMISSKKKKKSSAITVYAPTPVSNSNTSWACRSARPLKDKQKVVSNAIRGATSSLANAHGGTEQGPATTGNSVGEPSSSSGDQYGGGKGKGKSGTGSVAGASLHLNIKTAEADYYRMLEEERRKGNHIEDTFKLIQAGYNPDAAIGSTAEPLVSGVNMNGIPTTGVFMTDANLNGISPPRQIRNNSPKRSNVQEEDQSAAGAATTNVTTKPVTKPNSKLLLPDPSDKSGPLDDFGGYSSSSDSEGNDKVNANGKKKRNRNRKKKSGMQNGVSRSSAVPNQSVTNSFTPTVEKPSGYKTDSGLLKTNSELQKIPSAKTGEKANSTSLTTKPDAGSIEKIDNKYPHKNQNQKSTPKPGVPLKLQWEVVETSAQEILPPPSKYRADGTRILSPHVETVFKEDEDNLFPGADKTGCVSAAKMNTSTLGETPTKMVPNVMTPQRKNKVDGCDRNTVPPEDSVVSSPEQGSTDSDSDQVFHAPQLTFFQREVPKSDKRSLVVSTPILRDDRSEKTAASANVVSEKQLNVAAAILTPANIRNDIGNRTVNGKQVEDIKSEQPSMNADAPKIIVQEPTLRAQELGSEHAKVELVVEATDKMPLSRENSSTAESSSAYPYSSTAEARTERKGRGKRLRVASDTKPAIVGKGRSRRMNRGRDDIASNSGGGKGGIHQQTLLLQENNPAQDPLLSKIQAIITDAIAESRNNTPKNQNANGLMPSLNMDNTAQQAAQETGKDSVVVNGSANTVPAKTGVGQPKNAKNNHPKDAQESNKPNKDSKGKGKKGKGKAGDAADSSGNMNSAKDNKSENSNPNPPKNNANSQKTPAAEQDSVNTNMQAGYIPKKEIAEKLFEALTVEELREMMKGKGGAIRVGGRGPSVVQKKAPAREEKQKNTGRVR